jgi:hypothetical protein
MPFYKGNKLGVGHGRPQNQEVARLRKAILAVEKEEGKDLLAHFVKEAFKDRAVLIALIKKFVPDMTSTEVTATVKMLTMGKVVIDNKPLEAKIGE